MKRAILLLAAVLAGCLGPHVRSPDSDVPFVYPVGWWSYQDGLQIQSLEVKVLDSRLNLLNHKTLAQITITGEMTVSKTINWRPSITKAHLSEKIVTVNNRNDLEAEITVTPIIDVEKDKSYDGGKIPFSIKQEIILNSMGWGKNTFVIVSGGLKQAVTVGQGK
jgi:hypothetical protein